MRANARSSSRMYGTPKDFLKQFIQSNRVPKGSLIRALQAQRGLKCGAATNAADKIEELITSGHIEVRYDKCYWNRSANSASIPRWSTRSANQPCP